MGLLNNRYTKESLHITVADMAGAESIMDIVKAIEVSKAAAECSGQEDLESGVHQVEDVDDQIHVVG